MIYESKQSYYDLFEEAEISQGNSENTIDYLRYLLNESANQRLLIFWDGATYYCSKEIRGLLEKVNQGLAPDQSKIHCVRFAPNCPEQNPIEDIWLPGKTWVRRFCALVPTFSHLNVLKMVTVPTPKENSVLFKEAFIPIK